MDLATGDAIVTMDADLQHPPAHLPTMIERWRQGYDVVNMVKARSGLRGFGTVIEAVCASLFYGLFNLLSPIKVTPGIAEYRLLDRSCIVALSKVPERYRYPKGVIPQLDFRQVQIEFQCEPRQHGDSGYTLGRRVAVASQALAAFNSWRLFGVLALVGLLLLFAAPWGYLAFSGGSVTGLSLSWPALLLGAGCVLVGLPALGIGALGLYATVHNRSERPPRVSDSSLGIIHSPEEIGGPVPSADAEPHRAVSRVVV